MCDDFRTLDEAFQLMTVRIAASAAEAVREVVRVQVLNGRLNHLLMAAPYRACIAPLIVPKRYTRFHTHGRIANRNGLADDHPVGQSLSSRIRNKAPLRTSRNVRASPPKALDFTRPKVVVTSESATSEDHFSFVKFSLFQLGSKRVNRGL
jgi:hypothetical protein